MTRRVHADRPALADALEFRFLQDPQQLHLELEAHARDFVQEDGPAMRRLETASLVVQGAGERPLDMAEQLALQQALAQGAAVDANVRPIGPWAEAVNGLGDQLLAGAGLADQKHAGPRRRRQPGEAIHLAHRGALAYDLGQRCVERCGHENGGQEPGSGFRSQQQDYSPEATLAVCFITSLRGWTNARLTDCASFGPFLRSPDS